MVNLWVLLFGVSMLAVALTSRIEAIIRILALQGVLLFLIVVSDFGRLPWASLLLPAVEAVAFKAVLIPLILMRAVRRNAIYREVEPQLGGFYSLVVCSLIFVMGFFLAFGATRAAADIRHFAFGVSLSAIMTGLFLVMTRKKIITHIMGFVMCENGVFLLSLATAKEMPLLVSLGILLDIFIAIYLLVVFFDKIRTTFEEGHIDRLTSLQD